MNRRIIGVLVAVVLAAVGTFVLVNYVQTAEERALEGQETVEVLVVRDRIEEGTPAIQITESVDTERVPRAVRADGGVSTVDDLEGRVASVDLVPGEQVVTDRFVDPAVFEAEQEIEVPEGLQLVTFPVNQERAVGGQIRPGDTVGFIGSFSEFEGQVEGDDADEDDEEITATIEEITGDTTGFVIHKALVTRVQTDARPENGEQDDEPILGAGGDDEDGEENGDDAEGAPASAPRTGSPQEVDDTPPGNFLVTLAVEASDAERIVFTAEYGLIWLTLEPEDATEEGTGIRTRETIYE